MTMTTNNRIFDVNYYLKSFSPIITGNLIVNNVTKGYSEIYGRVSYFINNDYNVFKLKMIFKCPTQCPEVLFQVL